MRLLLLGLFLTLIWAQTEACGATNHNVIAHRAFEWLNGTGEPRRLDNQSWINPHRLKIGNSKVRQIIFSCDPKNWNLHFVIFRMEKSACCQPNIISERCFVSRLGISVGWIWRRCWGGALGERVFLILFRKSTKLQKIYGISHLFLELWLITFAPIIPSLLVQMAKLLLR